MRIAGLSAFGRSTACVVEDGVLVAAAAEEWFSRRKDDPALPERALRWCREHASAQALDYAVFAEKPVQKFIRILARLAQGFPATLPEFPGTMFTWLGDRLWLKSALVRRLGLDPDRLLFVERNLAQIAAAFLPSPHDSAAILIVDGSGEWATTTLARARTGPDGRTELAVVAEIQHPHSLVFLLDAVARHLLVPQSGGVPWLAALAAYGRPRYVDALAALVPEQPDGAFALDRRGFDLSRGAARFRRRVDDAIGPPRGDAEPLRFGTAGDLDSDAQRFADIARSAQEVCASRCLALAGEAARRTGERHLCVGGALFLDPRVLASVLAEAPFDDVFTAPHLDDADAAIGAALYVDHVIGKAPRHRASEPRSAPVPRPPADTPGLASLSVSEPESDDLVRAAVEALATGRIVGFADGPPEIARGPRGRRVLLADPQDADAVERLRSGVKLAETYVPLAGVALPGAVPQSDGVRPAVRRAAAQGLIATPLGEPVARLVPGVAHVDGSALLFEVDAVRQPRLAAVLRGFADRTGRPPILAHTSLNRSGDPVVLTPAEAVDLLRRSQMDILLWGDSLIEAGQEAAAVRSPR